MKKFKIYELFLKYLLSYVLVLCIPVFIIGTIAYSSFMHILKQEVISNNLNHLSKVQNIMDSHLKQMGKIRDQIDLDPLLKPSALSTHLDYHYAFRSRLNQYAVINGFIDEIFVYYYGNEYIYSSSSSYTIPIFLEFYGNDERLSETLMQPSKNPLPVRHHEVHRTDNGDTYIAFISPLTMKYNEQYGSMIFTVSKSNFRRLLESYVDNYSGNTIILDNNNKIVSSLKSDEYLQSTAFSDIISSIGEDAYSNEIALNGENYLFTQVKSPYFNWKYVTLTPMSFVMKNVNLAKQYFFYSFLAIFLLGSIVIYLTMNMNYQPIKSLKNYAEKLLKAEDNRHRSNELDLIKRTISRLSEENIELTGSLKEHNIVSKELILSKLLKGDYASLEDFNSASAKAGISIKHPQNLVVVLYFHNHSFAGSSHTGSIISCLENHLDGLCDNLIREHISENKIEIVLSAQEFNYTNIRETLMLLQDHLKTSYETVVTVGAGNVYSGISGIPASYIEASTAVDYRLVKGNAQVIFFNEILNNESSIERYPHNCIKKLANVIKQANPEEISLVLDEILQFISVENPPLFVVRRLCYDLINVVIRTIDEMGSNYASALKKYPDVFSLIKFDTVDELTNIIKDVCNDVCRCVEANHEKLTGRLSDEMLGYINENYADINFSAKDMADHFQMSLSHLSQFFKEHTGQTIQDYTTVLKIEKSKQLLSCSDLSIKDIAVEIGYYNVTSFIRRFKQITGTTPGIFREHSKSG